VKDPQLDSSQLDAFLKDAHPRTAFSAAGILSGLEGYEFRPAQIEMASLVWEVMERGGYAVIEAGTGTGKSLAYLYPAFLLTLREESRVVVATHTINLQQQLIEKEVPFLASVTGLPVKAAFLLGRGNYLCHRKLVLYRENLDKLPAGLKKAFHRVLASAENGRGCLEQMGYTIPNELRGLVVSEAETCLRGHCPYQEECFWVQARKAAFEAQIVISNHYLFCADLAVRRHHDFDDDRLVLPPYEHVVFDEAHHLETVAAEYLGLRLDEGETRRFCERLLHREGRWGMGWLSSLRERLLDKGKDLHFLQQSIALLESVIIPGLLGLEEALNVFFRLLREMKDRLAAPEALEAEESFRFTTDLQQENPLLAEVVEHINAEGENWVRSLSQLVDTLQEEEEMTEDAVFLAEAARYFNGLREAIPLVLDGTEEDHVHWVAVERRGSAEQTVVYRVPLEVGPLIHEYLYSNLKSAVFTSATLAVGEDFTYFRERLGLDQIHPAERKELILESPFNYGRQVLLLITGDLPAPDAPGYTEEVCKLLPGLIAAAGGRTLLLFTNRRQMKEVYKQLAPALQEEGYTLLVQGEKPRNLLLKSFLSSPRPVLFGMDSFWEGVDIPGPQLSLVVLMRLPFRTPSEPLFQARWEALQRAGRDPFTNLSLPEAVIKFKQGFGRLIRTKKDRGAVVILDQRICTRNYGRVFLSSIPGGKLMKLPAARLSEAVAEWLE
jgi:ATP-dependent DNA helicase DinG